MDEQMTIVDGRKLSRLIDNCCNQLVFNVDEISEIINICLNAINRCIDNVEDEMKE